MEKEENDFKKKEELRRKEVMVIHPMVGRPSKYIYINIISEFTEKNPHFWYLQNNPCMHKIHAMVPQTRTSMHATCTFASAVESIW